MSFELTLTSCRIGDIPRPGKSTTMKMKTKMNTKTKRRNRRTPASRCRTRRSRRCLTCFGTHGRVPRKGGRGFAWKRRTAP